MQVYSNFWKKDFKNRFQVTTSTRHRTSTISTCWHFAFGAILSLIATKPVQLQICPISAQLEGTPTIPPSYIRARALCGNAARDRQTHKHYMTLVANKHFASATPHANVIKSYSCEIKSSLLILIKSNQVDLGLTWGLVGSHFFTVVTTVHMILHRAFYSHDSRLTTWEIS